MSKEKFIIIITIFIDVIGLGIIIPIMPQYVESLGVSAFVVTSLFSVFALFSFLSAPFLGVLSDKIGRRPVLLISILSTAIGWFVFASGHSVFVLFLGRIIDGIAAGNFSTAQSAISDLAKDDKERTSNLGLTGAIFGIGFLIGPFLGGILSKVSPAFSFWVVGFLALINFILAILFLPETNKHIDPNTHVHWNPMKPITQAFLDIKTRGLYWIWFIFNCVAVGTNSVFSLYLLKVFGFGPFLAGLFFTGIGVIIALNQSLVLNKFWLKYFQNKTLIRMFLIFFTVGFGLMSFSVMWLFITGLILTAFGQSILRVVITSEVVNMSGVAVRGKVMGTLSGIASVASVVAPLVVGWLFMYQSWIPFVIGSLFSLVAFVIYMVKPQLQVNRA